MGVEAMTGICNGISHGENMPLNWMDSWLVPLCMGKGDARECGSYRGVKLLEHGMKVLERILEKEAQAEDRGRRHAVWFYARQGHN